MSRLVSSTRGFAPIGLTILFVGAISFRGGLGPVVAPTLSVDRSIVVEGDQVTITGAGFTPGAEVYISQCRRDPIEDDLEGCDSARELVVTADASGRFERQLLVYREVFKQDPGWIGCEPCVLQATAMRQEPATVSIRPTVLIVPDGPYQRNQRVQLRGSGFQAGVANVDIGWCRFNTDDPARAATRSSSPSSRCSWAHGRSALRQRPENDLRPGRRCPGQ